jgi:hypothetical protein
MTDRFLNTLQKALDKDFEKYQIEYLLKTPKSLKARIHLSEEYFIAVRYNVRNGRIDVALIKNDQRIFGYDNLKEWHRHPYEEPSKHVPCRPPSIHTIISDTRKIYDMDRSKI